MAGILTIGVVLQDWLKDKEFREEFNECIQNPIIREISIFSRSDKNAKPISLSEAQEFSQCIHKLRKDIDLAVDHEGGKVQRLRGDGLTQLPAPDVLRQLYEEDHQRQEMARKIAKACGTVTAYELGNADINILYGPVFDTYNPNAVVIGKIGRSYGDHPGSTDLLKHYLEGINGCLYTIAKHFPDHGQVANDTHKEIARDERSVDDKRYKEAEDKIGKMMMRSRPLSRLPSPEQYNLAKGEVEAAEQTVKVATFDSMPSMKR